MDESSASLDESARRTHRSHVLSNQPFNYHQDDLFHILKSDVYSHWSDEAIRDYIVDTLSDYDQLEG